MTKTLTEQWREGTLEYGYYYVKNTFGWKPFGITIDFWHGPFDKWGAIPNDYVQEVLAPVPSYEEYEDILQQNVNQESAIETYIEEIKRLKEQLNESEKTRHDLELIIKRLKRRSICEKQKAKARKEHINELIEQVKELKEEIARRGRIINELKIQRKEANEIIQTLYKRKEFDGFDHLIFGKYLEKWGLK